MAPVLDAYSIAFLINVFPLLGFLAPLQFLCGWIVPHFMPFFGFQDFVRPIRGEFSLQSFIATIRYHNHTAMPRGLFGGRGAN